MSLMITASLCNNMKAQSRDEVAGHVLEHGGPEWFCFSPPDADGL
jgi:hypothetical protein